MTKFIESFSTQQLRPPWISRNAQSWTFVVPVGRSFLQEFLDRAMNSAGAGLGGPTPDFAPYRYEALTGPTYGILGVDDHTDCSSVSGDAPGWNTVAMRQIYWSFPARRWRVTADNLAVEPSLVWITPFTLTDNSYVMFSSREIWGDESDMATILIDKANRTFDVSIEGIKSFAPQSISHRIGYLSASIEPEAETADIAGILARNPDLAKFAEDLGGRAMLAVGAAGAALSSAGQVFETNVLKQFRDVFDMRVAVYRALVASRTLHSNVRDLTIYDGARINLAAMVSDTTREAITNLFGAPPPSADAPRGHPMTGCPTDENGVDWDLPAARLDVALAISFTGDARFDVLSTLHTYGLKDIQKR